VCADDDRGGGSGCATRPAATVMCRLFAIHRCGVTCWTGGLF